MIGVHFSLFIQEFSLKDEMKQVIDEQLVHQGTERLVLSVSCISITKDNNLLNSHQCKVNDKQDRKESKPVNLLPMVDYKINFVPIFHEGFV